MVNSPFIRTKAGLNQPGNGCTLERLAIDYCFFTLAQSKPAELANPPAYLSSDRIFVRKSTPGLIPDTAEKALSFAPVTKERMLEIQVLRDTGAPDTVVQSDEGIAARCGIISSVIGAMESWVHPVEIHLEDVNVRRAPILTAVQLALATDSNIAATRVIHTVERLSSRSGFEASRNAVVPNVVASRVTVKVKDFPDRKVCQSKLKEEGYGQGAE
ncbi:hypothetical protein V8F06_011200 [Rhypophila decipiens]